MSEISLPFLRHAAGILAGTEALSWSHLERKFSAAMVKNDIDASVSVADAGNKQEKFLRMIAVLPPKAQYHLIKELCHGYAKALPNSTEPKEVPELLDKLVTKYGSLFEDPSYNEVTKRIIDETKHWLSEFPDAEKLYLNAESKWNSNQHHRNLVDDLRLSLELLLKEMFQNSKPIEKQGEVVGQFLKSKGNSPELRKMFTSLLVYFAEFQNTYAKHDDAVPIAEIEIVFELTSIFMKHLLRQRKS